MIWVTNKSSREQIKFWAEGPLYNTQNTVLPTNMAATDYNTQLSYSHSSPYWSHTPQSHSHRHTVYKYSPSSQWRTCSVFSCQLVPSLSFGIVCLFSWFCFGFRIFISVPAVCSLPVYWPCSCLTFWMICQTFSNKVIVSCIWVCTYWDKSVKASSNANQEQEIATNFTTSLPWFTNFHHWTDLY